MNQRILFLYHGSLYQFKSLEDEKVVMLPLDENFEPFGQGVLIHSDLIEKTIMEQLQSLYSFPKERGSLVMERIKNILEYFQKFYPGRRQR